MNRKRPETYEAEINGKKTRVTVPENDEQDLRNAIREQLSPQAVAAIVECLGSWKNWTTNTDVNRQVRWFKDELADLLGGYEQQARLAEELGL